VDALAARNMDWRLLHWQWQALLRSGMSRREVWLDSPHFGPNNIPFDHAAQCPPAFLQRPGAHDWAFLEVLEGCSGNDASKLCSVGQFVVDFSVEFDDTEQCLRMDFFFPASSHPHLKT
jgi:hypothetical protein